MTTRLTADGAVAFADGGLFMTNTIQDSFAVVDTNHTSGISVLDENRFVGKTGDSGRVLIPDLRAYESNRISIEPNDVSVDADVATTVSIVRPKDRSGVVVKFPIHASHGALVVLVMPDGKALPLGTKVVVKGRDVEGVVGHDGQAFLRDLAAHNELMATGTNGFHCSAFLDYEAVPGNLPKIGPLTCR